MVRPEVLRSATARGSITSLPAAVGIVEPSQAVDHDGATIILITESGRRRVALLAVA